MYNTVLVMSFQDESGKMQRISVADARDDLDAATVKAAAQDIINSAVFSVKGKFTGILRGQLVKTDRTVLFNN